MTILLYDPDRDRVSDKTVDLTDTLADSFFVEAGVHLRTCHIELIVRKVKEFYKHS